MPYTHETSEIGGADETPIALECPTPPQQSAATRILSSIALATFCFALAHLSAEAATGYLAAFKFHWLGPSSNLHQLEKLREQYEINMSIEVVWLIPASVLLFFVQLGLGFHGRGILRRRTWAMGVAVGVCYCWARWGLWGLSKSLGLPFPESANFVSSMFLAVVCGAALARWRRA